MIGAFLYSGTPFIIGAAVVVLCSAYMLLIEKSTVLSVSRLTGPLMGMMCCLYLFARGRPHDASYLIAASACIVFFFAALGKRVIELAHFVLRLRDRHTITRNDHHCIRRGEDSRGLFGSGASYRACILCAGRCDLHLSERAK